ncbi:transcription factor IIIc-like protein [Aspergillus eucalypticola CBS 122712]|uniref:Transcription factor IIIc-like protein n=1 Tax=Aspergillus eucalypticola (strain CBS 122712 / IBT 29274) TaxID=1448314 RepID=A0A317W469_ASPEC|nr:transcription factor IIIc-like protein [Aspergillus eucalypticola CBS 122712]PWY81374.1 transcription factor IIIc-like protein [Aspergillus eucalypticola CBS 122712]
MPRTYGKKKQTRLAFAPLSSPPTKKEDSDKEDDRRANLRYAHPSMPVIRRGRSQKDAKSPPQRTPEPKAVPVSDSDSDIEIVRSTRKNPQRGSLKRKRTDVSSSESPSATPQKPAADSESDADEVVPASRRKLRRGVAPQPALVADDSDSEEELVISPKKRRTRNASPDVPQTPRRELKQDELDIEEDLQALQDSVVKDTRTRGRLANSARAQRQQHLEALRRRRAGKTASDTEESKSDLEQPETGDGDGDSDGDDDNGSEQEDEPETHEENPKRKPQFRTRLEESDVESAIASNDDLDRYEDDFVLEDDDDTLGAPTGLEDIPIEFSRHAYKQLKDYFQDAVEWMVHNQLNPAFPRSDPVYEVAFSKLEDEVKGRTGSQLVSSVWNAKFRRALLARPQIEITTFPTIENHPCDACNRSGHPASFDIKLYGKAYSLKTLEPLTDDDSDDDDDDDDDDKEEDEHEDDNHEERDRDGHILPDENTRFFLGRHCKNKATLAHTLTHWRFHLNEWVTGYLEHQGYLSETRVVERSHWSTKKKTKYAVKAVESMITNGEVKKLWRDFHINLRTARETTTLG